VIDEGRSPTMPPVSGIVWFALLLQLGFLGAVLLALGVTVVETPAGVRSLALLVVTPIVVLAVICFRLSWRRSEWGFAGAGVLGAIGVGLRLVISTQPSLEVGGGLPFGITIAYVVLGTLVSLTGLWSVLELRRRPVTV
jgi:hypothetical protein